MEVATSSVWAVLAKSKMGSLQLRIYVMHFALILFIFHFDFSGNIWHLWHYSTCWWSLPDSHYWTCQGWRHSWPYYLENNKDRDNTIQEVSVESEWKSGIGYRGIKKSAVHLTLLVCFQRDTSHELFLCKIFMLFVKFCLVCGYILLLSILLHYWQSLVYQTTRNLISSWLLTRCINLPVAHFVFRVVCFEQCRNICFDFQKERSLQIL